MLVHLALKDFCRPTTVDGIFAGSIRAPVEAGCQAAENQLFFVSQTADGHQLFPAAPQRDRPFLIQGYFEAGKARLTGRRKLGS